jgi:DNA recombination protein RmuC
MREVRVDHTEILCQLGRLPHRSPISPAPAAGGWRISSYCEYIPFAFFASLQGFFVEQQEEAKNMNLEQIGRWFDTIAGGAIPWMPLFVGILIGFFLGLAFSFFLKATQARSAREIAFALLRDNEEHRRTELNAIVEELRASFGRLSLEALSQSTNEFLKLAKSRLDSERDASVRELEAKKGLIDEQLARVHTALENTTGLIKELERDRLQKFGELTSHLRSARQETSALLQTTNMLREALANTKTRGQWGERLAEDVLKVAGFVENINYLKQKAIKTSGARPDFTFLLPKDRVLNMDVKFPLDNYVKYLEAETDLEKAKFRNHFLRDVKTRIKEVTARQYIDPEQNTLDYVLLFIPNEQVYAFIHEQDTPLLDTAMKNKVILCSPFTLFAVLAVIRQAVDNFALEKTSGEILSALAVFQKQWDEFVNRLTLLGKRIGDAQKEYDLIMNTRKRQLERPLKNIDDLRTRRTVPEESSPDDKATAFINRNEV